MAKALLDVIMGKQPERYPIWFLRQAGRYLPEYREVRGQVSFLELCKNPKLAAEVTWQPLRRYDLDAAIIFSDILVPCVAMGQELTFDPGHGPVLSVPVRDSESFKALREVKASTDLAYVGDAISLTKSKLAPHQTMIGFAGAPFTVASYMIEGGSSKTFLETKRLLFNNPEVFTSLLKSLSDVTIEYLQLQVSAGAEYLMLFDTWANQLSTPDFDKYVLPILKELCQEIKKFSVPLCYFPGQGSELLHLLGSIDVDVIAVDWRVPLSRAHRLTTDVGLDVTYQGNLDPLSLVASEQVIRERVRFILDQAKCCKRHIFNVGHGLLPVTPPESLGWVVDEVRKHTLRS